MGRGRSRSLRYAPVEITKEQETVNSEQLTIKADPLWGGQKERQPHKQQVAVELDHMADFLFEIGLEEVPARMIAGAEAELLRRTVALLGRERLLPEDRLESAGASFPR